MMTRAYTIRFDNTSTGTLQYVTINPVDAVKEHISEQVSEMATSIYMAAKQLFMDFMHFIFVDVMGQLSLVLVLLALLALVLGATKFSAKSFKWGLATFIISLLASYGWGE